MQSGKATAKREPKTRAEDCGNGKAKIKTGDRDGGAQTAGRLRAHMGLMRPGDHHNLGPEGLKPIAKVKPKTGWEAQVEELRPTECLILVQRWKTKELRVLDATRAGGQP